MAESRIMIDLPAADVFEILVTPSSYPEWLVGCERIRGVDRHWPQPGSAFHHVVGIGPLHVADSSAVVAVEPPRLLKLDVMFRPFGRGLATFELRPSGPDRTEVALTEKPASPTLARLRLLVEPLTKARNDASLAGLSDFVDRRLGRAQRFAFGYEGAVGALARASGATDRKAWVALDDEELRIRFGPFRLRSPRSNVAEASRTGPYASWRVAGPLRVSLADRGLSFATTTRAGVCVRFHDAVALDGWLGRVRHPAVTVTVAEPDRLVATLSSAQPSSVGRPVSKS